MKSIIRKAFSVSAAAVMISAFAVQAGAYTAEISDTEEYQFNKPYLNINVDGGDIDFSEIVFSLKNSDGEIVASWKGDSGKFNEVADGLYDITDIGNFTTEDWRGLPWDKLDKEKIESENPYGTFRKGSVSAIGGELYTGDYVYPVDNCYYEYIDNLTGETMTVPANTIVFDSDNAYSTNGDNYSNFSLETYEDESDVLGSTYFKDYAGKKTEFPVSAGKYKWFVNGGNGGGVYATSYEDTQEYVQAKLNLQDLLSSSIVTDNYEFIRHFSIQNITVYCPTIGPKNTGYNVSFAFLSGSVVSAPIPDNDGNIYVWLNTNDPILQFQDDFIITRDGLNSYGGGTGRNVSVPTVRSVIKAKFEMPTDGLTLYNIPSGDYTVEIDSTEYALENNTITVTDTKDMQSMNIVLKDAGDSSSESSSETSSTSSEVSSSETSSSDTSSASSEQSSSSEVSSSQASSSTNTSSVTNSKTSSNAASTGNTANNSNNTPNPATGAAAGFTGIALIAGAAIVVSKKSRK